jgi:hypothetical protein
MEIFSRLKRLKNADDFAEPGAFRQWMTGAIVVAALFCAGGLFLIFSIEGCGRRQTEEAAEPEGGAKVEQAAETVDLMNPVRPAPASFPPNSNMPPGKESVNCGPVDLKTFDPERDLVRFEDARVWFESDHDGPEDDEDDHLIYRGMEIPLRRLVNLMEKRGAKLKVQDAYRALSSKRMIHLENSLHREGRAVDLTAEGISLGELAKLCWQAGFDFVLYEAPKGVGSHLHCSVKRLPKQGASHKKEP